MPLSFTDTSLPEKYAAMEDAIAEIDRQYKYWSEKEKGTCPMA